MGKKIKSNNIDEILMLEQQKKVDSSISSLLLLILTVLPLLTRTTLLEHFSPLITGTLVDSGTKGDVFTYYKFLFLLFGCLGLSLFYAHKMTVGQYKLLPSYINAPLAIMVLFVLFSVLFADYKTISLFGEYNRHDGTLTYLGYFILFFAAASIVFPEEKIEKVMQALYIIIAVNASLNLLYFYGVDVLKSGFIHGILFPSNLPASAINAGAHLDSTINNPNYVSGLASVFTLLLLTKAALEHSLGKKIVHVVFACLSFAMELGSLSTSGFFTIVALTPIVIIILCLSKHRLRSFATFAVALLAFSGIFSVLNSHNHAIWKESIGFFLGQSTTQLASGEKSENVALRAAKYAVKHSPFSASVAYADTAPAPQKDEFDLPKPGWSGGTGRTYIWKKTFQLIEKRPIFGYGLDTLAYYFPQGDWDKAANLYDPNTVVDKPHNMYIGMAYGSGIVVLLAFLYLICRHLWEYIKFFRKRVETKRQVMVASLFMGWAAYLVQALLNDSIIGPAVVFWILFGISVSLVRQENKAINIGALDQGK